jgi:hypothetical protein
MYVHNSRLANGLAAGDSRRRQFSSPFMWIGFPHQPTASLSRLLQLRPSIKIPTHTGFSPPLVVRPAISTVIVKHSNVKHLPAATASGRSGGNKRRLANGQDCNAACRPLASRSCRQRVFASSAFKPIVNRSSTHCPVRS